MPIYDYLDPIIFTWHTDTYGNKVTVNIDSEQRKVVNGQFVLEQIPSVSDKVTFVGKTLYEININKTISSNTLFKVDYAMGIVYVHSDLEGQTVNVSYKGRGYWRIPWSRIYSELNSDGTIKTTLDEYIAQFATYQDMGEYSGSTTYETNNMVYYKGSTYICTNTTSITGVLPTDSTSWRTLAAGLNNVSEFSSITQYYNRDVVTYNNNTQLYICKKNGATIGTLPTNTTYWDLLISIKDIYDNFAHKGIYSSSTIYYPMNIVYLDGSSFICKKMSTGNIPSTSSDTTYWGRLAIKGDTGLGNVIIRKESYDSNTQYNNNEVLSYEGSLYVTKQSTIGHDPTDITYWYELVTKGINADGSVLKDGTVTESKLETNVQNILDDIVNSRTNNNPYYDEGTPHTYPTLSDRLDTENLQLWGMFSTLINVFSPPYNATGQGSIDDSVAFQKILDNYSNQEYEILIPSGIFKISQNITFAENVALNFANGAILMIDSGVMVTINGTIKAGLHQIFGGLGTITGNPKVKEVYPQWFGAKGDGVNDDTDAIQKAVNFAKNNTKVVYFSAGSYKISSTINSVANGMAFIGSGMQNTLIMPNGSFNCFNLIHNDQEIKKFCFVPSTTQTTGYAINIVNSSGHKISYLTLATFGGINWDRGSNGFISNISLSSIKGFGINLESSVASGLIVDVFIDTITGGGTSDNGYAGLRIGSGCAGVYVSKVNLLTFGEGIVIDNTTSGCIDPDGIFLNTVLGDTCHDNGWKISNGINIYLDNCWGATATNFGFNIIGGSNINLSNCKAINNGLSGINIDTSGTNGNGVNIEFSEAWGNSTKNSGNYAGINVSPNISNFKISSCKSGRGAKLLHSQAYGLLINTGTSNDYIVTNNDFRNNLTSGFLDGGSGTNKIIIPNLS